MDKQFLASNSLVQEQKIIEHYMIGANKKYKPLKNLPPGFNVLKKEIVKIFEDEIKENGGEESPSDDTSSRQTFTSNSKRTPISEIALSRDLSAKSRKKTFNQTALPERSDSSKLTSERSISLKAETLPSHTHSSQASIRPSRALKVGINPKMGNKSRSTIMSKSTTKMNSFFTGAAPTPIPKHQDQNTLKVKSLQNIDQQHSLLLSDPGTKKKKGKPALFTSSLPDLNSLENSESNITALKPIDEHQSQAEDIMVKCAQLYKDCSQVEKKIANAEKGYVRSLGDLLKRIKKPKIKWDYWRTDKDFLIQKERVAREIEKMKAEKNGRVFDIDVYIKETFFPDTLPPGYTPIQKDKDGVFAINPFAPSQQEKKKAYLTPLDRLALKIKSDNDNSLNQQQGRTFQMTEAPENLKTNENAKKKTEREKSAENLWLLSPKNTEKENAPEKVMSRNLISLYRKFKGCNSVTKLDEHNNFINNFKNQSGIEISENTKEKEPHLVLKNKLTNMALNNTSLHFATRLSIIKELGDRNPQENKGKKRNL